MSVQHPVYIAKTATKEEVKTFGESRGWDIDIEFHDDRIMAQSPVQSCPFPYFELNTLIDEINKLIRWDHEEWLQSCQELAEIAKQEAKQREEEAPEKARKQAEFEALTANFTEAAIIGEFGQVLGWCRTDKNSNGGRIQVAHTFTAEGDPCNVQQYKISRSKANMKYATLPEQTFFQCQFINGQAYYYAN